MALSDLDQALLELAVERGVLTETGVQRVRDAVLAKDGPDVESAIFDQVDGATFQKLCKELPDFYARRLKARKPLTQKIVSPTDAVLAKEWFQKKAAAAEPPPPGKIGRYQLERELGRGAQGVVHRVRDEKTDTPYALKILSQAQDPTASERFFREMKALSKVAHPNVVAIRDLGEDQGRPYYVMELVEGSALAELIEREGAQDPAFVSRIARDMLQGLGAIHAQSIVHRDVKPANILIDRTGRAVLIDFSVASLADTKNALTKEGFSVGTPVYMAPEQIAGEPTGPYTDLYALGVTLFVALEGHSPYGALASYDALADAKLEAPPPPVRRKGVPHGLVRFVLKLMASAPEARFPSAKDALFFLEAEGEKKAAPLLGGYELQETVSRAGETTVYRARSLATETLVALSVLDPGASSPELARLTREARALGRVRHVNVRGLVEGGTEDGRSFLALEWVEGETLEALLSRGPLPLETVLALATGLARGLAAVHEKNVLHRDVRAQSVLVLGGKTAKLSGFGLSKLEGDEEEAPSGEPATRRLDLHALGALLSRMAPDVGPLAPIVAALLAQDPEKGYASADSLAQDLELVGNPPSGTKPWWKVW